jgi:streptogramin lyase
MFGWGVGAIVRLAGGLRVRGRETARLLGGLLAALAAAALLVRAPPPAHAPEAPSVQISEFSEGIAPKTNVWQITAGPDGNLWFTESPCGVCGAPPGPPEIGRITPAGVITEFSEGITGGGLSAITAGPDGSLWFIEPPSVWGSGALIGRISPAGVVSEFSAGLSPRADIADITAGPDGNLWFTESPCAACGAPPGPPEIGRITPVGVITEFTLRAPAYAITAGPDGALWFTEPGGSIGRITPEGVVSEFATGLSPSADPTGIASGPDGNLWFTEQFGRRIGRITPTGLITEFPVPGASATGDPRPFAIAAGPDGALWFTETQANLIGRISTEGLVSEYPVTPGSTPRDIALGPDGNLWFTETDGGRVGRVVLTNPMPAPPTSTPSLPPSSVPAPPAASPAPGVQTAPTPGLKRSTIVGGRAFLVIAAVGKTSRVVSLRAQGLTRGSRVVIRGRRGLALQKAYTVTAASRDFTALFRSRLLPSGTVITLRVTKAGLLGREFRWKIVGHRLSSTTCRASAGGALTGCLTRIAPIH